MGSKKKTNPYFQEEFAFFFFYNSIHLFIHSYHRAVFKFLFVTRLAEKLYKILHTLSVRGGLKCWRYPNK
ncbi:hypothetical protein COL61_14585 [Bacillus wiedmannii]|nr:hypothetical protein COL61_14585 [Bacillus wiedmannii]